MAFHFHMKALSGDLSHPEDGESGAANVAVLRRRLERRLNRAAPKDLVEAMTRLERYFAELGRKKGSARTMSRDEALECVALIQEATRSWPEFDEEG